ncbi:hypothetical protein WN55_05058 [Dufourea novaeangliae]|uniref:39S ribosomal protein L36, mitochondrial n=1 Tax=Dufourea novaeangliae TaxID=178035 RepID=A0A154PP39_DUFNO|nr:hypothetical protein WN55_05058 [Dufourea novaeangliae]
MYSNNISSKTLLQTIVPMYNITCNMKTKTVLHRRCKYCVLHWKEGVKYVKCKVSPRHNQVQRMKQPRNTWILTFASQKPIRDW